MDLSEVKNLPKIDHTPAKLDDVSKLLMKAADLIESEGWCGHTPQSDEGPHCVAAAVIKAGRLLGLNYDEAYSHLRRFTPIPPSCWNDEPGRTKDEVVAKLRAVALGG